MKTKQSEKLKIYNKLRKIHSDLFEIIDGRYIFDDWHRNALDAVSSVLYLAEGVFSEDK